MEPQRSGDHRGMSVRLQVESDNWTSQDPSPTRSGSVIGFISSPTQPCDRWVGLQ